MFSLIPTKIPEDIFLRNSKNIPAVISGFKKNLYEYQRNLLAVHLMKLREDLKNSEEFLKKTFNEAHGGFYYESCGGIQKLS